MTLSRLSAKIGWTLATISFGLWLVADGLKGLADARVAQPVISLARDIELDEYDGPAEAVKVIVLPDVVSANCLPKPLRASLTLRLYDLDNLRLRPFEADAMREANLSAAYQRALDEIDKLLICTPTDGNAWLMRAMVENARNGPSPVVFKSLQFSLWLTPFEAKIDRARRNFASALKAALVVHPVLDEILAQSDLLPLKDRS